MNSSSSKSRKSNNSRRSGNRRSTNNTPALLGGFTDRCRVTLRYVDNVTITPSGVTAGNYVFTGNDVFDPDVTSTGLQPCNFDDFAAQYSRYRVWGSKLRYSLANNTAGALDMCTAVVGPRHLSTAITTQAAQENFQCQPYTQVRRTIIYNNGMPSQAGSISMSTQKFLGLSNTEFQGQDDLAALTSASPGHRWFWHLTITSDDQSSTTPHYCNVMIDYDVEFWDRVDTTLDLKYERLLSVRRAFSARKAASQEGKTGDGQTGPPAEEQSRWEVIIPGGDSKLSPGPPLALSRAETSTGRRR